MVAEVNFLFAPFTLKCGDKTVGRASPMGICMCLYQQNLVDTIRILIYLQEPNCTTRSQKTRTPWSHWKRRQHTGGHVVKAYIFKILDACTQKQLSRGMYVKKQFYEVKWYNDMTKMHKIILFTTVYDILIGIMVLCMLSSSHRIGWYSN